VTRFVLIVHVLAVILTIGPISIAASMFPPAMRAAQTNLDIPGRTAVPVVLHRITRVYAVIGIVVPVFGVVTGAMMGVLASGWLIASILLTVIATAVLVAAILPTQRRALDAIESSSSVTAEASLALPEGLSRRLAMYTGMFNLVWVVVVALMIYRPGSTIGEPPRV
jgi:hypothetical protein